MKIAIVGMGYVGSAMSRLFAKHHSVCTVDVPKGIGSMADANGCALSVVCVPTPMSESGACDTSIVEEVIGQLTTELILLKSTVPPGTTDRLKAQTGKHIVFSPEYCGESSYWTPYKFHTDVIETPFFTFGGSPEDTSRCVDIFTPVCGPTKFYRQTSALAAEVAKYMENTFYATKIAFCYEMAEICKAVGADYNEVRELWLQDPRINPMHTLVFPGNNFPFSGKCLPKDLSGLIASAQGSGYEPCLLKEVRSSNTRIGAIRKAKKEKA